MSVPIPTIMIGCVVAVVVFAVDLLRLRVSIRKEYDDEAMVQIRIDYRWKYAAQVRVEITITPLCVRKAT
jgi:hypothetical protein